MTWILPETVDTRTTKPDVRGGGHIGIIPDEVYHCLRQDLPHFETSVDYRLKNQN